jgi:hypothetical protein
LIAEAAYRTNDRKPGAQEEQKMLEELLLWGLILALGLGSLILVFWIRRIRHRAAWKRKRPIPVQVQRPPEQP